MRNGDESEKRGAEDEGKRGHRGRRRVFALKPKSTAGIDGGAD